ncbi:hypothetical protein FKM82_020753 [Ascaphus truei]
MLQASDSNKAPMSCVGTRQIGLLSPECLIAVPSSESAPLSVCIAALSILQVHFDVVVCRQSLHFDPPSWALGWGSRVFPDLVLWVSLKPVLPQKGLFRKSLQLKQQIPDEAL